MLNKLKAALSGNMSTRRLSENLPDEPVAVTALLLEAAEADNTFAPEERTMIMNMLKERYSMDTIEVSDLIAETQEQISQSPDLWPFTRAIASRFSEAEKGELLTLIWQVVYADGQLDPLEEQLTRKLQTMLSVNHSVIISSKLKAKGQR